MRDAAWRGRATAALGGAYGQWAFDGDAWSGWSSSATFAVGIEVQRRLGGRWAAVGAVGAQASGNDLGETVKAATDLVERQYRFGVSAGVAAAL